jgi:quercetin dioxygenase-like cupin family protein
MTTLSGDYPGLAAVLLTIPPTSHAPEARHDGEEWLYLLQGSVEVTVGDEGVPLEPGDALHFSSSTTHTVCSVGDAPAGPVTYADVNYRRVLANAIRWAADPGSRAAG